VVDDGPMTICDMGTDVVRGTVAVGVLWDVAKLVLIVTVGISETVEHMRSNESMILCAVETSEGEGLFPRAQLTQSCTITKMAVVQRQPGVLQFVIDVATDEQSDVH
jgi:Na+/proline symporter